MLRYALLALTVVLSSSANAAETPRLGQPADPGRLTAWDIDVSPNGSGLPQGRGSASDGARTYVAKCAMCHGPAGRGGPADRLTGGLGTLRSPHPVKTVTSYWPYATTLFGFIRAAMPITHPRSLSASEVYGLCAYLLSIDGVVPRDAVLDRSSLPDIAMPNRHGFRSMWKESGAAR
jgi:mono/diheme cytochrome c family protein